MTGRAEDSAGCREKWGSPYEISLGNPSDAGIHNDCGYSMKESLLSGLPVLISSTQAMDSSSPSFFPHLCAGVPLLKQGSKVILWPAFPGQVCGQTCQVGRISVSVCAVFVQRWVHAHPLARGGSIVTAGNLSASCSTLSPLLSVAKMLGAI